MTNELTPPPIIDDVAMLRFDLGAARDRVKHLEAALLGWKYAASSSHARCEKALNDLEKAKLALRFYAEPANHALDIDPSVRGQFAQETLRQIDGAGIKK